MIGRRAIGDCAQSYARLPGEPSGCFSRVVAMPYIGSPTPLFVRASVDRVRHARCV